jgi:hypothetical protein
LFGPIRGDVDDRGGVRDWHLAKDHLIDQREDRRVRANAEGNREHRHRGEQGHLAKAAQRVPQVGEDVSHGPIAGNSSATPAPASTTQIEGIACG